MSTLYENVSFDDFFSFTNIYKIILEKTFIPELCN